MVKRFNFVFLFLFFCCSTISVGPEGAGANYATNLPDLANANSSGEQVEKQISKSLVVKSSFYDQVHTAFKEACKKAGLKENLKPKRTFLGFLIGVATGWLFFGLTFLALAQVLLGVLYFGLIVSPIFVVPAVIALYTSPFLGIYVAWKVRTHCSQKFSGRGAHKKFYCEFSKSLKTIARELYQDCPNEQIDQIIDAQDSPVKSFDSKDFFLKNIFKSVLTSNVETREQALESVDFARAVAEILAK